VAPKALDGKAAPTKAAPTKAPPTKAPPMQDAPGMDHSTHEMPAAKPAAPAVRKPMQER
jgi:hypothetical protein